MKTLSNSELGYIVALIDGEGWLCLRKSKTKYHYYDYSPEVAIRSTNQEVIYWLRDTTCLGNIHYQKSKIFNRSDYHEWKIPIYAIPHFLNKIKDLLLIKKEQAYLILDYYNYARSGSGKRLTDEIIIKREEIHEKLEVLNKRGHNRPVTNVNSKINKEYVARLTDFQASYLAGLMDGEGTIALDTNGSISITITNTFYDLIEWCANITGFGTISNVKNTSDKHKLAYTWRIDIGNVELFLRMIQPYLIIKRDQADLMLTYIANYVRQKDNQLIFQYYKEMAILNYRGNKNNMK